MKLGVQIVPFQFLIYEKKDNICYLTLNRPANLNALNSGLLHELHEAFEVIELDSDIRVVILTGAGRAFSAGFDLERGPKTPTLMICNPLRGAII